MGRTYRNTDKKSKRKFRDERRNRQNKRRVPIDKPQPKKSDSRNEVVSYADM
jgi:hypothetical protein